MFFAGPIFSIRVRISVNASFPCYIQFGHNTRQGTSQMTSPTNVSAAEPVRHKSAQEEKEEREHNLDQTIADSFPASDPPSTIPDPDHDEDEAA